MIKFDVQVIKKHSTTSFTTTTPDVLPIVAGLVATAPMWSEYQVILTPRKGEGIAIRLKKNMTDQGALQTALQTFFKSFEDDDKVVPIIKAA